MKGSSQQNIAAAKHHLSQGRELMEEALNPNSEGFDLLTDKEWIALRDALNLLGDAYSKLRRFKSTPDGSGGVIGEKVESSTNKDSDRIIHY